MTIASFGADFSRDRRYRYHLWRRWGHGPACVFVMLNPSTADATTDDPTIRRCLGFARREGCGRLDVVNLFALRATEPATLFRSRDPIGRRNDTTIRRVFMDADLIIAAWGVHGRWKGRDGAVASLLRDRPTWCLGLTRDGHPRHPLYLAQTEPLVPFANMACKISKTLDFSSTRQNIGKPRTAVSGRSEDRP